MSSAATSRSRSAARWPLGCAAPTPSRSCSSATAPSRRGTSTRRSTSRALWKLPLILVCENNGFAEFTPRSAHTIVERVSDVVAPYEIERGHGRRQRRRSPCGTAFGGFLERRARRVGPVPAGVPDAPAARPLRGRPRQVPRGDRRGRVAAAGPDPAAAAPGRRSRAGSARTTAPRPSARPPRSWSGRSRSARESDVPGARAGRRADLRGHDRDRPTSRRSTAPWPRRCAPTSRVFVLGEDVAEGGPYTATAGLAEEFGAERVLQHADLRGARSPAWRSARPSPACGRCWRSCSSTSSRSRSTSSSTRRRRRTSCRAGQLSVPLVLRTQGGGRPARRRRSTPRASRAG